MQALGCGRLWNGRPSIFTSAWEGGRDWSSLASRPVAGGSSWSVASLTAKSSALSEHWNVMIMPMLGFILVGSVTAQSAAPPTSRSNAMSERRALEDPSDIM